MSLPSGSVGEGMFSGCQSAAYVRYETYLVNGLSNLDKTYRKYSLAPTDDRHHHHHHI